MMARPFVLRIVERFRKRNWLIHPKAIGRRVFMGLVLSLLFLAFSALTTPDRAWAFGTRANTPLNGANARHALDCGPGSTIEQCLQSIERRGTYAPKHSGDSYLVVRTAHSQSAGHCSHAHPDRCRACHAAGGGYFHRGRRGRSTNDCSSDWWRDRGRGDCWPGRIGRP